MNRRHEHPPLMRGLGRPCSGGTIRPAPRPLPRGARRAATGRQTSSRRSTSVTTASIDDDEGRQHEHAGEHAGDVEHAFGLLDQIAEPGRGAEIFADHRADHGKADRGVQRGEHPRQRRRPIDVAHQLPLVHAEHARIGEHRRADFLDALIDVEEHDEEHQRDAERDLRPDAEAEPEREDRRQHHARQRVDHLDVRIEHRGGARLAREPEADQRRRRPSRSRRRGSTSSSVTQRCFQITPLTNQSTICWPTSTGLEKKNGGSSMWPKIGIGGEHVPERDRDDGDQRPARRASVTRDITPPSACA